MPFEKYESVRIKISWSEDVEKVHSTRQVWMLLLMCRCKRDSFNWVLEVRSSWAGVDVDSGRLLFSEESAEYYGMKQMEHELHHSGDEYADLSAENVVSTKLSVAPLRMKRVEVDRRRGELVDAKAVVSFIPDLLSNEWSMHLAMQLTLV
jgi:hypothetical protein